jgi:hypothetical protein
VSGGRRRARGSSSAGPWQPPRKIVGPVGASTLVRADALLAPFTASSVTALLHAGCSSPSAGHRRLTCLTLLSRCWVDPPRGTREAGPEDLLGLVDALRESDQRLQDMEDCVPLDPRPVVRFRGELDGRRFVFPLHPGDLEEPLAVASELLRYAEALDPLLVQGLSMGIADVLEVAGQLMSAEGAALRPTWRAGPPTDVTAAPLVTAAEVLAAGRYLDGWQLERLGAPLDGHLADDVGGGSAGGPLGVAARLGRAVEFVTAPASRVRVMLGWTAATLGPVLAVRGPAGVCPVPAAFVLEATSAVARVLADRVLRVRPAKPAGRRPAARKAATSRRNALGSAADRAAVDQRWRRAAFRDLYEVLGGAGAHVMYPVEVNVIGRELLLLVTGHRHVLAIDIVSGLDPEAVAVEVAKARRGLARLTPEARFRLPQSGKSWRVSSGDSKPEDRLDLGDPEARTWSAGLADALPFPPAALAGQPSSLAPGTVVDVLVLVAGPWQPNPMTGRAIPVCTVDELRSLLFNNADREEVWAFLAELADLGGGEDGPNWGFLTLQAFSILDVWQLWREQGMLAPAWVPDHALLAVHPRRLGPAWRTAADRDALDELLLAVGLPGVRSWPFITDHETSWRADADGPLLATGGVPAGREAQPGWGSGPGERSAAALTRAQPRHLAFASVPDQLVVAGSLEFVGGWVFDRRFAATLLDALLAGLQRLAAEQPAAWAVWRQAHEQQPVRIDMTPRQEPADSPGLRLLVVSQGASDAVL